jgi:hypothetical protein
MTRELLVRRLIAQRSFLDNFNPRSDCIIVLAVSISVT